MENRQCTVSPATSTTSVPLRQERMSPATGGECRMEEAVCRGLSLGPQKGAGLALMHVSVIALPLHCWIAQKRREQPASSSLCLSRASLRLVQARSESGAAIMNHASDDLQPAAAAPSSQALTLAEIAPSCGHCLCRDGGGSLGMAK